MSKKDLIMKISKPTFMVKLHPTHLEVDLQRGTRKKLEDVIEEHPTLKGSLGILFQHIIHLDVALKDIEKVEIDKKKQVKIIIPHRRDITIPLEQKESIRLINKLNELIPKEKQKELQRLLQEQETKRQLLREGISVEGLEETKARMLAKERE
jgi:hypothetical protein